jgi:hypothetical protein
MFIRNAKVMLREDPPAPAEAFWGCADSTDTVKERQRKKIPV